MTANAKIAKVGGKLGHTDNSTALKKGCAGEKMKYDSGSSV